MNLDRLRVVEILQSHDGLNEEGLGIVKVEVEECPWRDVRSHSTTEDCRVASYIIANPVYTPLTPFDTSPRS